MAQRNGEKQRQPATAVVLGGGGPVGRAWEFGIAAGLQSLGIDLGRADLIIGTSAGAAVGAQLALGLDISNIALVVDSKRGRAPYPTASAAMQDLLSAMGRAAASSSPEAEWRGIGETALTASSVSEEESLARTSLATVTGRPWPGNFHATTVNTRTGRFRAWSETDKVPLERACAASTGLPGVWPPITIGDDRYMDGGVRSMLNSDLAAGYSSVLVVSCFALTVPEDVNHPSFVLNRALLDEFEALRRGGSAVEVVAPNEAFSALTKNGTLMLNNALVPAAYEIGRQQGEFEFSRIRRIWSSQA